MVDYAKFADNIASAFQRKVASIANHELANSASAADPDDEPDEGYVPFFVPKLFNDKTSIEISHLRKDVTLNPNVHCMPKTMFYMQCQNSKTDLISIVSTKFIKNG
uniref:Uncharacterized protein n=1 Tax=Romanomermis culicivorax TaxID=13658 RepID=A0A915HIA6_ROMCU